MNALFRLFTAFVCALVVAVRLETSADRERSPDEKPGQQRYFAHFPNYILPLYLGMLLPLALLMPSERAEKIALTMCVGVFLHITVYYVILALALPLLRRSLSARVCATLWLLPNYLYVAYNAGMAPRVPRWAIPVSGDVVKVLALVWGAGFLAVLGWKTVGHFSFRSRILEEAWEEQEPETLRLWNAELERAGYAPGKYKLVRSSAVQTPLTIGFFKFSIRVILPERAYTPEELRLIFRHELVHIGREDAATKFFLVFCTAMCWFNPLMWWAVGRSSDDLELSCDETVLLDAEEPTRRQYADLLLRTAGDERGYTSCLSASARALRYRLGRVMQPGKRIVGGLVAGAVFMALFLTSGYVALAFDRGSGAQVIFNGEPEAYTRVEYAANRGGKGNYSNLYDLYNVTDEQALKDYLSALTLCDVGEHYDFSYSENVLDLRYEGPGGKFTLTLSDHVIHGRFPGQDRYRDYFVEDEIDWTYLKSLLVSA